MDMWAKSERRWRKKGKRGVSPIIATILLVAITVVLAAVLYILISGLTKGPSNTPIGADLAVSPAHESGNNYTFQIVSASGGLALNNMQFQIQNAGGGVVTLAGSSTLSVTGLSGAVVAVYDLTTGTWSSGGTLTVSNGMAIVLVTTTPLMSQGYTLQILGTGSFSGSVPAAIP